MTTDAVCKCGLPESDPIHVSRYVTGLPGHRFEPANYCRIHDLFDCPYAHGPRAASRCPGCGLYMSFREEDEQGQCNDCNGGAS